MSMNCHLPTPYHGGIRKASRPSMDIMLMIMQELQRMRKEMVGLKRGIGEFNLEQRGGKYW